MLGLIDSAPLWAILLGTIVMVLVTSEIGFFIGIARARSPKAEDEAQVSSLTAAHLGLMAFIMAFTFSMAADHTSKRKGLILQEANAIEVAHLRAGLINTPQTKAIQLKLAEYAQLRASIAEAEDVPGLIQRSEEMLKSIWQSLATHTDGGDPGELEALLVEATTDLVVLHEQRVAAATRTRVPPVIWMSLYLLLSLSMLGMGYFSGMKGKRSPLANTALAFSFAVVMFLIADLDRPRAGLVKLDQSLMQQLADRLEAGGRF